MDIADEPGTRLKEHLGWSKPRVTCFVYLLLALLRVKHLARLLMQSFGFMQGHYYLTLDRTDWKWGKSNLNINVVYRIGNLTARYRLNGKSATRIMSGMTF